MKPSVSYSDFAEQRWREAFNRIKSAGEGAKFNLLGIEVELDFVLDDPHPPSLWLKWRDDEGKLQRGGMRRGNPMLLEMKPR